MSRHAVPPSKTKARAIAAVAAIFVATLTLLGVKWQVGDMFARLTKPTDDQAAEIADTALAFAPTDPYASDLRAQIGDDAASTDTRSAVEIADRTVRLAPADHRWRITLARAFADDGQLDRAEAEFKRAIDLAPGYAICHWYYGNFLLRRDRRDEALAEFRAAAGQNWDYRGQVFSLVWDLGGKDPAMLASVAGEGPDNTAHLAFFLAGRGRGAEALQIWNRLDDAAKAERLYLARVIAQALFEQMKFPEALEFSRQIGGDPDAAFETVTNGSFESSIDDGPDSRFGWNIIRGDPKLDIAIDNRVKHDGGRSLRLAFRGTAKPDFANVVETVAVSPNTRYRLTFWLRTENLKAAAGPEIDVLNGNVFETLGRTPPFANGTGDWQQMTLDIVTPGNCTGIVIRTIRASCGGDECPILGTVWYDDFVLTRQ